MNPLERRSDTEKPELFEFAKTREDETVVQAAIRFLLAHEEISVTLVGFSDSAQIDEALEAVSGYTPLTADQLSLIRENSGRSFEGICTGCQYCDSCPEGIPNPKFMDAYNHLLLYSSEDEVLARLKNHWNIPADMAARCTECGSCEEACTQHLPIIERLRETVKADEKPAAEA